MAVYRSIKEDGYTLTVVATIPSEDVIVKSSTDYIPQYVTDVYGETSRITKDITLTKLLHLLKSDFPEHELVSIGTPVNFDVAPTHLTRVEMQFESECQMEACLKAIEVSDVLIRTRIQPAWDWQAPVKTQSSVVLHVGWYDTVYFMQNRDIFIGELHCRYSAKFNFNPNDARITHFRYNDMGDLDVIHEFSEKEKHAASIMEKVEFIRRFRDGRTEKT